ncbi:hypothetical protein KY289_013467 [Solanum tuberosum]|nr:hypothetical protein KY289_013467 [Solanum tuberosum]
MELKGQDVVAMANTGSNHMFMDVKAKGREKKTFLATLIELKPNITVEFADVMRPELPKKLLPRRDIDHKIEWLPGSIAPVQAHHRIAPKELTELCRQLYKLLYFKRIGAGFDGLAEQGMLVREARP